MADGFGPGGLGAAEGEPRGGFDARAGGEGPCGCGHLHGLDGSSPGSRQPVWAGGGERGGKGVPQQLVPDSFLGLGLGSPTKIDLPAKRVPLF